MTMNLIPVDLLETFVAVVEAGSFTKAARTLGVGQSTVSQKIARLEATALRQLLDRDTHRLSLTTQGESLLEHARRVIDAHLRLKRSLTETPLRGRLRLGASEDFVLSALPDVLATFARRHPEVDLEVRAGLSHDLYDAFDGGQLDVILVKRRVGDRRGVLAWRESIRWVGQAEVRIAREDPLQLLLYPAPSVTRARAIEALEAVDRRWRVAFTSASLTGLTAAARAGLGVMPHSARLMPAGLTLLDPNPGLPILPEMEFVVLGPGGQQPVAQALITAVLHWAAGGR
jgi:DNA-binding transcriptional LysR family regulator